MYQQGHEKSAYNSAISPIFFFKKRFISVKTEEAGSLVRGTSDMKEARRYRNVKAP
jgi:hypothetical protein